MQVKARIALVALVTALVAACATSPTGRKQLMLVSEQQAISASRQAYVQEIGKAKQAGKLVTDPRLLNRIEVITERLVAQAILMRPETAKWEWSVQVIDDPKTVNAWCMAGGRMAIYTGLIQQVDPPTPNWHKCSGMRSRMRSPTTPPSACPSRWPAVPA